MNALETNGKTEIGSLRKETKDTEKNQVEILDLKNTEARLNSSKKVFFSRGEGRGGRISDMEGKKKEVSRFEQMERN